MITAGEEKPVSHGTVSIVIPARNAATTLVACLQSIHQLDPAPLEVIVVDDASMDDTAEVALPLGLARCLTGSWVIGHCRKRGFNCLSSLALRPDLPHREIYSA